MRRSNSLSHLWVALLLVGGSPTSLAIDSVDLVLDINPVEESAGEIEVRDMIAFDGRLFFDVDTPEYGRELWASDGTPEGTTIVRDIVPGSGSALPSEFALHDGELFFGAGAQTSESAFSFQLWVTDGTADGTRLAFDQEYVTRPSQLTSAGGKLFYETDFGDLWAWSSSDEAPVLVSSGGVDAMTGLGDSVLFVQVDDDFVARLFTSDGTVAGTRRIVEANADPDDAMRSPRDFERVGDVVYFNGTTSESGSELWVTDGTDSGTRLVADVREGPLSSNPGDLTSFQSSAIFTAIDDIHGLELWICDGSASGTRLIKDVDAGRPERSPRILAIVNGELYFQNGSELWRTDGTALGTRLISFDAFTEAIAFNNTLFLSNETMQEEFWSTDGTALGTGPLIDSDSDATYRPRSRRLTVAGNRLFFIAVSEFGTELWSTDGTTTGTSIARDIARNPGSSAPGQMAAYDGGVLFRAFEPQTGDELWRTDGTAGGTALVKNLSQFGSSSPRGFTELDGQMYFHTPNVPYQMWRTDGSETGTVLIRDFSVGGDPFNGAIEFFRREGDGLLLSIRSSSNSSAYLLQSDGSFAGTQAVAAVVNSSFARISSAVRLDDNWFLGVTNNAEQLWVSDGTPENTTQIRSFPLGGAGTNFDLRVVGNSVVFVGDDSPIGGGGFGRELWRTDGTPAGTTVAVDLNPGSGNGLTPPVRQRGDQIYWLGSDGINRRVWSSDGTPTGTVAASAPLPSGLSQAPQLATGARATFFIANDSTIVGDALYATDGTEDGTVFLTTLRAFSQTDRAVELVVVGNTAFFVATSDETGEELWRSDGTVDGTRVAADIVPGSGASLPQNIAHIDGDIYFSAFTSDTGRELYKLTSNIAPWFDQVADQTADAGVPLVVDISFQDANAQDVLVTQAVQIPVGATWNSNTAQLTWTPLVADAGVHTVTLRVDDDQGLSDSVSFNIDVLSDPLSDFDNDGVVDLLDNCIEQSNPAQADTDGDGYGNRCDADLNNDCVVNVTDLGALRLAFFTSAGDANWNPDGDFDSDGTINVVDLGLLRTGFFEPPGPSGVGGACGAP